MTPTAVKPLRAGFKIKNTTENQSISGCVRVLQISSPIEWEWQAGDNLKISGTFRDELLSMVRNNPKSVEYTGLSLAKEEAEFVIAPATAAAYNSYGSQFYTANSTNADVEVGLSSFTHDMSMNNLILVIEASSAPQIYNLTYGLQVGCRYPANTVLGENSRPSLSRMSSIDLQDIHDTVTSHGSKKNLHHRFL